MIGWFIGIFLVTLGIALYAILIYRFDRYEKEPLWLLILSFLWGRIAAPLGAVIFSLISVFFIKGIFVTVGIVNSNLFKITAIFVGPPIEEFMKGLWIGVLYILFYLRGTEFNGPIDGIIYGSIIGLGFALSEDIMYITSATLVVGDSGAITTALGRTLTGLIHPFFTSFTGLGFGISVITENRVLKIIAPFFGYTIASILHGIYNTYTITMGANIYTLLIDWLLFFGWFVLVSIFIHYEKKLIFQQLKDEISLEELKFLLSPIYRQIYNFKLILFKGYKFYKFQKQRQNLLFEIAFLKDRLKREPKNSELLFPLLNKYRDIIAKIPWYKGE